MNYLSPYLDGPPGGKLKLAAVTQLGLGMAVSIWEFNVGAVIAILGIMAVVSSNEEYLKLYFFFTPGAILIDVIQLLTYPRQSLWVILMFASMLAKLAGMYFSWDLMNMSGGDGSDYQQAWSGPTPGQQSQHVAYNPPQQPPPSQQQHPPQQQHAPPAQNEADLCSPALPGWLSCPRGAVNVCSQCVTDISYMWNVTSSSLTCDV